MTNAQLYQRFITLYGEETGNTADLLTAREVTPYIVTAVRNTIAEFVRGIRNPDEKSNYSITDLGSLVSVQQPSRYSSVPLTIHPNGALYYGGSDFDVANYEVINADITTFEKPGITPGILRCIFISPAELATYMNGAYPYPPKYIAWICVHDGFYEVIIDKNLWHDVDILLLYGIQYEKFTGISLTNKDDEFLSLPERVQNDILVQAVAIAKSNKGSTQSMQQEQEQTQKGRSQQ